MFKDLINKYKKMFSDVKAKYKKPDAPSVDPALKQHMLAGGDTEAQINKRFGVPEPSFFSKATAASRPDNYQPPEKPAPAPKPVKSVATQRPEPIPKVVEPVIPEKKVEVVKPKPDVKMAGSRDFNIDEYVKGADIVIDSTGQLKSQGNTLAIENNNPGNLRYAGQPNSTKGRGGFAKFPDPQTGFRALYMDVLAKQRPERNLTLRTMMEKYSPPHENDTELYINTLEDWLGVNENELVNGIDTFELAKFIARFESQTSVN